MNYFIERENQIRQLKNGFAHKLNQFPEHLRYELTSLLAFAINEVATGDKEECFDDAIIHITEQQGFMSYCTLSKQQRMCVDVFAHQDIPKQEHLVFSYKNYLDTLRIRDANAKKLETARDVYRYCSGDGFVSGFVSISKKLGLTVVSMVSANTGGKREN